MSQRQVLGALRRGIDEKHCVQISREPLTQENWTGYPIALSDALVLLHVINDFSLDGFLILPLKDISYVRHGPAERFWERVLREEGTLAALPEAPAVRLDHWRTALEDVKRLYQHAIIECEASEGCQFFIGPLLSVAAKKVALRYFQVEGILEEETTLVPFTSITALRFEQRYIQCFAKYSRDERTGEPLL
jgi:hypothetical protein